MWLQSVLLLVIAIAVIGSQGASAEPFVSLYKGKNYDNKLLGYDGQGRGIYEWTSKPERILVDGQYHDYKITETPTSIKLETANSGALLFNKNTCAYDFHKIGFIDELNPPSVRDISWTVKGKAASGTTWSNVNAINNAACQTMIESTESTVKITGQKQAASGIFQIVLDYVPGRGIKETMRAYNNNPAWTNHNIGFTETLQVPRVIQLGNHTYDLAQYNQTVLGRTWIENNDAKVIFFNENVFYDFGIGFENLENIMISWDGANAKVSFNYLFTDTVVPYQQWFEVDPTFGYSTATQYESSSNNAGAASASCNNATYGKTAAGVRILKRADSSNSECYAQAWQWNVSTIPDTSAIRNSTLRYDVATVSSPLNCDFTQVTNDITTASAQTVWEDVVGVTSDVDYVPNQTGCTTVANDKTLNLGSTFNSYLQNTGLGVDRIAIGVFYNNQVRDASTHTITVSNTAELKVVYVSGAANAPTDFDTVSAGRNVQFSWTASTPLSGSQNNVTAYFIGRSLDNSTWTNQTNVGNVTSYITAPSTYWRPGLLYYTNITASITSSIGNSTADYDSFTMDNVPDPPSLEMVPISGVAINASSTAGASSGGDTVTDFALRCEINNTGGWQSVVSNSTLPSNRKYTVSGYWATGDIIICQQRDGNDVGWSGWSANATYPAPPDAVTDLEVIAVFQTTAQIMWSEPELHGVALWGYQVNYTSPWGIPTTIITETNSSDTEYAISGLLPNTQYSFRVSAITGAGTNASGNIENVSTITDFSVGDIDLDDANPFRLPIRFVETELNSTTTEVEVIYDNEFELDCELYFQFAQDRQEYDNLNGTEYDDDNDSVLFYFNNAGREVITIDCTDAITNSTGRFQMMQSDFPLLDLIAGFRDGTYGTQGQFGVLDLVTLLALIFGMVGFNRTNPSVGVIFMFFVVGGLAAFGIVQWYTAVSGMVAVIIMAAVAATRKDD